MRHDAHQRASAAHQGWPIVHHARIRRASAVRRLRSNVGVSTPFQCWFRLRSNVGVELDPDDDCTLAATLERRRNQHWNGAAAWLWRSGWTELRRHSFSCESALRCQRFSRKSDGKSVNKTTSKIMFFSVFWTSKIEVSYCVTHGTIGDTIRVPKIVEKKLVLFS